MGWACGGCASHASLPELAERLAVLPRRMTVTPESPEEALARTGGGTFTQFAQPDVRGTVVLVVDDRVAVLLDEDSPPVPINGTCAMAIAAGQSYKAELVVVETLGRHALGRIIIQKAPAQAGDRATCKTP